MRRLWLLSSYVCSVSFVFLLFISGVVDVGDIGAIAEVFKVVGFIGFSVLASTWATRKIFKRWL